MGSNDYYRFANIAQRHELLLIGKAQCWRRAGVVYVVLRK